jgi:glycosyltransferase involved in cell wall biosynthesis
MKVLHIITGLNQGGAETVLYRLVTNSNEVNHVIISLTSEGIFGHKFTINNIPLYCLNMNQGIANSFKGLFKLFFILRKNKPDVVQTWMYHSDLIGGIIAKISGYKNIYWGVLNYNLNVVAIGKKTRIVAKCCALLSGLIPTKIISCSLASIHSHKKIGYKSNKFINIPLGFDLSYLHFDLKGRNNFRNELKIKENTFLFGCIARWDPQKDHNSLLKALKTVINDSNGRDFLLLLIGPEMSYDNIELCKLINPVKNNVRLLGKIDNINNAFSALDVHVLSSLGESFPNVVAESMACKTPCIVTDVGDASFIVGKTGWVVPPSDPKLLADAILNVLELSNNPKYWENMRQDCRNRISENFSLPKMVAEYNNIWSKN